MRPTPTGTVELLLIAIEGSYDTDSMNHLDFRSLGLNRIKVGLTS